MGNQTSLTEILQSSSYVEALFDRVPDVVFFVKDGAGRYRLVNTTLAERCGLGDKRMLIGRTTADVFPSPLGERFLEQDRAVIRSAEPIVQRLELHLYPNRHEGWCLTDKLPLLAPDGGVCGIAGISRDLQPLAGAPHETEPLVAAIELIRSGDAGAGSVAAIAGSVGLSPYQLNRRLKQLLGITARQLLTKTRIDTASRLLRTTDLAVGEIAQRCGYFDQSAFTRQFRRSTGMTPRQYRAVYDRSSASV